MRTPVRGSTGVREGEMMAVVTVREDADGSYLRADVGGPVKEAWMYRTDLGIELHVLDGPRELVRNRIAGDGDWSFADVAEKRVAVQLSPRSP